MRNYRFACNIGLPQISIRENYFGAGKEGWGEDQFVH